MFRTTDHFNGTLTRYKGQDAMDQQQVEIYQQRRERLMEAMGPESIGIWAAPPVPRRNRSVEFPFRQQSDLLYLSGCREPDAVLVLLPSGATHRSVLFVRARNVIEEVWTGRRMGLEQARTHFGVDATYPVEEIDQRLPELMVGCSRLFYRAGLVQQQDQQVIEWMEEARRQRKKGKKTPGDILDADKLVHAMRLYKDRSELQRMRKAAAITVDAHTLAMGVAQPGLQEFQIEALLHYEFRKNGCNHWAYQSTVASGENATVLNYTENDCTLEDGDLLLIDAGGELDFYAADIARTFPVNGHFSTHQRAIYEIVLEAQEAAIKACRPGARLDDIHDAAVRRLTQGLVRLEILEGDVDTLVEEQAYEPFYMHKTTHWLGLEAPDTGPSTGEDGLSCVLAPGMTLTVGPGLYFNPDYHDTPTARAFDGIGVRLEDNILITDDGHENLTAACPKSIEEVEAIAQKRLPLP